MDRVTTDYSVLEQCLGSLVRYIQLKIEKGTAIYLDEIPEDLFVPSLYFPIPRTTSRKVTFQSWLTTIYMDVWFMASNNWLAYAAAAKVRDAILEGGCVIPIVDIEGTETGKWLRLSEPEVNNQDFGVVRLTFSLKNYFKFDHASGVPVEDVKISGLGGESDVLEAWARVTQELRKKEEENKLWLQEATKSLQQQQ